MESLITMQSDKRNNTTNTDLVVYTFKGITYELVDNKRDERRNWKEQIIRDFLHCEETKDWITIKNRISNGLMWGWLRKLTDSELAIGVKEVEEKNEQGFW